MAIDPFRFADEQTRNGLRSRAFDSYAAGLSASPTSPDVLAFNQYAQGALSQPMPGLQQSGDLRGYFGDVQNDYAQRDSELRRKVAAFELAGRPSPEQEEAARKAAEKAPQSWLSTVLDVVDTPRRWTYENLIVPATKSLGLVAPDAKLDPTGYDVFIKALGGSAGQKFLSDHLRATGMDAWAGEVPVLGGLVQNKEGASEAIAQKVSGLAGFGLDILFDPLTYFTLGAGGTVKAGGRALAPKGVQLMENLRRGMPSYSTANDLLNLIPRGKLARETEDKLIVAATGAPGRATLVEPEVDAVFNALRSSTAAPDLFKKGGAQFKLPMNLAELSIPVLNREEQWGLFLGGVDASKAVKPLNALHATLVDLGGAALAKLPVLPEVGGAVKQGLRNIFVPYAQLQGVGRPFLTELLKAQRHVGSAEREVAFRGTDKLFKTLNDVQKERVHYWLDIGAQRMTPQGTVEKLDFDDYALEQLQRSPGFQTASAEDQGRMLTEEIAGLESRLEGQVKELKETKDILDVAQTGHTVKGRDLAGLRDTQPQKTMAGVDLLDQMVKRVEGQLSSRQVVARHDTDALVKELENAVNARRAGVALPPTTLEQLEPDKSVQDTLRALLAEETATTSAGPIRAILDLSMRFGQKSFLQNYLGHIRVTQAPGIAGTGRAGGRQLGVRKPGEIGKQRTASFLAEPEELEALGYLTDPQAVVATKLAQYRTMARESNFVGWVLEHYGKKLGKTTTIADDEQIFNPRDWFTKGLPGEEDLREQLQFFREKGDLTPEEFESLINAHAPRGMGAFQNWVLPKDVVLGLQETRRAADKATGFFAALDGAMAVLRAGATLPAPSYHTRNMLGNIFNSTLGGVSPMDMRSLNDAIDFTKGKVSPRVMSLIQKAYPSQGAQQVDVLGQMPPQAQVNPEEMHKWFTRMLTERGVLSGGRTAVETKARLEGANAVEQGIMRLSDNPMVGKARNIAAETDNFFRLRHVFSRMDQGDTLEEAILSAKKYLFDYSDLSDVERRFLRPGAFFYTWTRKNLPLMLETLLVEPRKYSQAGSFFRAASDRDAQERAELSLMPAYLREKLGIVTGVDDRGRVQVLSGLGLPIEDINTFSSHSGEQFLRKLVGFTNPVIQAMAVGAGMPVPFTGDTLFDDAENSFYRNAGPTLGKIRQISPGFADFLGIQEREITLSDGRTAKRYTGNPVAMYVLTQLLPLGRVKSMADRFERMRTEESSSEGGIGKWAAREVAGVNVTDLDLQRQIETLETSDRSREIDKEHDAELDEIAALLERGDITSSQWRARRKEAGKRRALARDEQLQVQLREDKMPLGEDLKAMQSYRNTFVPEGRQLLEFVFDLTPDDANPLDPTGAPFESPAEFAEVRAEFMRVLKEEQPEAAAQLDTLREKKLKRLSPKARALEEQYQVAIEALDAYYEVPKYIDLSKDEERRVDAVNRRLRGISSLTGNPGQARQVVMQADPEGFAMAQRARRNTRERQRRWRELDKATGGLLSRFFKDVSLEDAALVSQYTGEAMALPGFVE